MTCMACRTQSTTLTDSSYKSLGIATNTAILLNGISMFFGRRKPEEVSVDNLNQFLNLQFEKKLGQLGSRSRTITDNLNQTILKFSDACDRFEKLEAEPSVEGRYSVNINSIKTQKGRYTSSLKHILSSARFEVDDAANSYDKYRRILSDLERMIKDILEANANFKIVLYCYSNHLWDFKSLFSEIERRTEELKSELGNKSDEFSEYSAVGEHILRLNNCREGAGSLKKGMDALKNGTRQGNENSPDKDVEISRKLCDKKSELARLNKERSSLHDRITSLTLPLERASKKLDHLSSGKAKLHVFVEKPINTINNESEYGEFRSLVQELNKKIHEGSIDLKNGDKVSEAVSMLLNSDIYSMINSFKAYQQKELEMSGEIDALERGQNEIRNERTASERHAQEMADMEARAKEIEKNKAAEKSAIEKLFLDHYGVLISIID